MQIFIAILAMFSLFATILIIFFVSQYFFGSFPLIKKYYEIKFYDFLLLDENTIEELRKNSIKKLHNEIINNSSHN